MKNVLSAVIPVLVMIVLIPFVPDDYTLTGVYVLIIAGSLLMHKGKRDLVIFAAGFAFMILSEYLFISTGVETFTRNSLFGLMPLWLPFLWGYGFIAISRIVKLLEAR